MGGMRKVCPLNWHSVVALVTALVCCACHRSTIPQDAYLEDVVADRREELDALAQLVSAMPPYTAIMVSEDRHSDSASRAQVVTALHSLGATHALRLEDEACGVYITFGKAHMLTHAKGLAYCEQAPERLFSSLDSPVEAGLAPDTYGYKRVEGPWFISYRWAGSP